MTGSTSVPTRGDRRPVGAIGVDARSLAPDLARGAMLLLIALANAHVFLYGHQLGVRGYPVSETIADRAVTVVQMTLVDGRAYPMFAALFGYGIVQILRRQTAAGLDQVAVGRLVRRRGAWLVLLGFAHALLLFSGDIIGAYGLLAVVLAGVLLRTTDRRLLSVAGLWLIVTAVFGALQGVPLPDGAQALLPSMSTRDPLLAAAFRAAEWVGLTLSMVLFSLVPALLLGVWAARRRLLDDPERHRRFLLWAAVVGIGLAVAGGLPMALMAGSVWQDPAVTTIMLAGSLHAVTGYAGGIGYAAVAGLVAIRVRDRRGAVVAALAVCGQRSMTCYLSQSVVFVAVLAAYGGGLGDRFGIAPTAALAVGTWALTVLAADIMRRCRHRGPAELLLRRLTYGRRPG
ncbi:MAG: DUF418 domain-containing protein [Pseudonocardiaceae bacterium]|nr:DUF418 domain-containing protein [Pseudonocardiaceae bacterium]